MSSSCRESLCPPCPRNRRKMGGDAHFHKCLSTDTLRFIAKDNLRKDTGKFVGFFLMVSM